MQWTIPGTLITGSRENVEASIRQIEGMFLGGGMIRSQVAQVTGVEPHDIQNWVKRGFLSPPQQKRYNMEQVCRLLIINMLKGALPLEQICSLISYINGSLTDESDDIIDDAVLYFKFVSLAARARHIGGSKEWSEAIGEVMENYAEPFPGAREKVTKVLRIMLTAWIASQLRDQTNRMITELTQ